MGVPYTRHTTHSIFSKLPYLITPVKNSMPSNLSYTVCKELKVSIYELTTHFTALQSAYSSLH